MYKYEIEATVAKVIREFRITGTIIYVVYSSQMHCQGAIRVIDHQQQFINDLFSIQTPTTELELQILDHLHHLDRHIFEMTSDIFGSSILFQEILAQYINPHPGMALATMASATDVWAIGATAMSVATFEIVVDIAATIATAHNNDLVLQDSFKSLQNQISAQLKLSAPP